MLRSLEREQRATQYIEFRILSYFMAQLVYADNSSDKIYVFKEYLNLVKQTRAPFLLAASLNVMGFAHY